MLQASVQSHFIWWPSPLPRLHYKSNKPQNSADCQKCFTVFNILLGQRNSQGIEYCQLLGWWGFGVLWFVLLFEPPTTNKRTSKRHLTSILAYHYQKQGNTYQNYSCLDEKIAQVVDKKEELPDSDSAHVPQYPKWGLEKSWLLQNPVTTRQSRGNREGILLALKKTSV